jgi:hypothetical protein
MDSRMDMTHVWTHAKHTRVMCVYLNVLASVCERVRAQESLVDYLHVRGKTMASKWRS